MQAYDLSKIVVKYTKYMLPSIIGQTQDGHNQNEIYQPGIPGSVRRTMMGKNKAHIIRWIFFTISIVAVVLVTAFSLYMEWEEPPAVTTPEPIRTENKIQRRTEIIKDETGRPFETSRQDGVFTMLLVGNDDGNGNTDTIILGRLDTVRHKMDFVSIPRDTFINVDWDVRKINCVYWGAKNNGGSGIEALMKHVKKLTGFEPDCYAVVDLDVFVNVVDTMGGVWFDVPEKMYYLDEGQDLEIALEPGYQLLNGYQSMGLCRYRSGYITGDIGRISMQQEFLKTAISQFATLGNIPNISKVVDILAEGLDTNLTGANIAYFLHQGLLCGEDGISFHTAPSDSAYVGGLSYAFLDIVPWLDMVNEYLNPFDTAIGTADVDIVFTSGGSFASTTRLLGDWIFYKASEPEPAAQEMATQTNPDTQPESAGPELITIPAVPETTAAPKPTTQPKPTDKPETPVSTFPIDLPPIVMPE